ncbi:hypothetical protein C8R43DRAFT_1127927 [Mycena crocata]|nr:hypothetical protein C8R43DRAFT_1127927 [Mycena crocata]
MSIALAELDPHLPVELERGIFELAAETHLPGCAGLLLVAQRVKIWIEPILYRTLLVCETADGKSRPPWITPRTLLELLHSRPATFFHDHVRNMFCTGTTKSVSEVILRKCSGTHNLYFLDDTFPTHLPLLAAMAPQRLYVSCLSTLFSSARVDFHHPLFMRVTHFEANLLDFIYDEPWAGLGALPCLTHLAVSDVTTPVQIKDALTHCKSLVLLVVLYNGDDPVDAELAALFAHEPRFVQLAVYSDMENWKVGALGGEDHWSRAEAIVRGRQLRKIDETMNDSSRDILIPEESLSTYFICICRYLSVPLGY